MRICYVFTGNYLNNLFVISLLTFMYNILGPSNQRKYGARTNVSMRAYLCDAFYEKVYIRANIHTGPLD